MEDFQDDHNEDYISLLQDNDFSPFFREFLTNYAWDNAVLVLATFWHMAFLVALGVMTSDLIWAQMRDDEITFRNTSIPINNGMKLLLFGLLFGSADYIGGVALSVNHEVINRMTGFAPTEIAATETLDITSINRYGTISQSSTITRFSEIKKDFFAMSEMLNYWQVLFYSQRTLQKVLPYAYLVLLEGSILLAWYLTISFY